MSSETIRLLISCADTSGIIAAVAGFIAERNGNILEADQHTDPEHGAFFMRVEIDPTAFALTRENFAAEWQQVAQPFGMRWRVHWGSDIKRMAILVSKESHCLDDLLWRWRTGELHVELPLVISNHDDLREPAQACDVAYHHLPVTPETKPEQEGRILELLGEANVDFIVLARYMQILSPTVVDRYENRIINIHHSFLPAFSGPRPYRNAYERGVKIIGATSHYVTADLDAGPIIAQGTIPVDHRDSVHDLIRRGRDLERVVLASAVRSHVEDKILTSQNKTVVFA